MNFILSMRSVFTIIILSVLSVGATIAQDQKEWTLQECVKVALENNLRVKRSVYNVESSGINLLQSKAAFLPTLNANGAYGKNYGRSVNPVTNLFINSTINAINVSANSSLTLFNGLRIQNTFRQSQKDYSAAGQDLEKAKNDVIINVVTLYTNVIFNKELFETAKYQLNSSQQQLERIVKQVNAGSLAKTNELNQEAQVATNEVNLINQENALNLSLLQLKQAMQIPSSTTLEVVIPDLQMEDLVIDQSAQEIYQIALAEMPEIKSAVLKVESAQLALKASKGNLYPRVSLSGSATSNYSSASDRARLAPDGGTVDQQIGFVQGTSTPVLAPVPTTTVIAENYGEKDQLKDNVFRSLSLGVSIPLFNGLQTRSSVQRAVISREIASISQQETENTLRQSIETAYNDAIAASKSYGASLKQVNAREEAYRMTKQRFENGAANFVEYQISENDLFQAKSDLSRAKYNFIFKKKVLDFYQGKPLQY